VSSTIGVEVKRVSEVLLGDGWHAVETGTFAVGDLRFVEGPGDGSGTAVGPDIDLRNPVVQWSESDGSVLTARLAAVQAVKVR
jgi:hypothetical protein